MRFHAASTGANQKAINTGVAARVATSIARETLPSRKASMEGSWPERTHFISAPASSNEATPSTRTIDRRYRTPSATRVAGPLRKPAKSSAGRSMPPRSITAHMTMKLTENAGSNTVEAAGPR